jgi:hypothetical protein
MRVGFLVLAFAASSLDLFATTSGFLQCGNDFQFLPSRAAIYGPDPGNPYLSAVGQSSLDNPSGSTVYGGPLLQGSGYTFAVFGGSLSTTSNSMYLLASTTFRTATANVLPAGLVFSSAGTYSDAFAGEQAYFQIRVWDNKGGTITTWAQAEAAWVAGNTDAGVSPILVTGPLGGTDSGNNPVVNPLTTGWQSFNLYYIPEPRLWTLTGLFAATVLVFCRRKF